MYKRRFAIILVLSLIVIILESIYVYLNTGISTQGVELGQLQEKVHALDIENMLLQEKVLNLTSLKTIDEKAKKEGMEKATFYYVTSGP